MAETQQSASKALSFPTHVCSPSETHLRGELRGEQQNVSLHERLVFLIHQIDEKLFFIL